MKPLKSKMTISDLLDIIHTSIIKEEGKNNKILSELKKIDKKINSGKLKNHVINAPLYWTGIFKDIKDNGYKIQKFSKSEIDILDRLLTIGIDSDFFENNLPDGIKSLKDANITVKNLYNSLIINQL